MGANMRLISGFGCFLWGSLAVLGFYTSARVAEQVRAGILSLARGQGWAALALGLTQPQAYIYVLLPMAYRVIISQCHQEQRGRPHHRAHGAHGAGACHAGILSQPRCEPLEA
jgi:hypothetical protein